MHLARPNRILCTAGRHYVLTFSGQYVFNTGRKPSPPGAIARTRSIKRWKSLGLGIDRYS